MKYEYGMILCLLCICMPSIIVYFITGYNGMWHMALVVGGGTLGFIPWLTATE